MQESIHVFTSEWCSNIPYMNAHQLDNFIVQLCGHHTLRDGIQHQIQYKSRVIPFHDVQSFLYNSSLILCTLVSIYL
jgi:hypothetical protein